MLIRSQVALGALVGLQATCLCQSPNLHMTPAPSISQVSANIVFSLSNAPPNGPFTIFVDLDSGPVDLLGERFYLGFTNSFVAAQWGQTNAQGTAFRSSFVPLFPGASGLVIHGQGVVLDPAAPNGLFRVSNAASSCLTTTGTGLIVQTFDGSVIGSLTGNYSTDVPGQVRGAPVTTRTVRTVLPGTIPFNQGITSPLDPEGCREQVVYRASDLGATGEPERILAMRWRAQTAVQPELYQSFTIRMAHTSITPDYTVDPFTALPTQPNSGLAAAFADNEQLSDPSAVVYSGNYAIDPAHVLPGNYMPYPMAATFDYDGVSSLLIDFRAGPTGNAQGLNGMAVNLALASSSLPGARCVAAGTPTNPINPNTVADGLPDNAIPDFEFVFARTTSTAQSAWIVSNTSNLDYGTPVVAKTEPLGTSIQIEYRGGDQNGNNPTAWSSSPDVADGRPALQYRITFVSNHLTGERPLIDTLAIPVF